MEEVTDSIEYEGGAHRGPSHLCSPVGSDSFQFYSRQEIHASIVVDHGHRPVGISSFLSRASL